MDDKQLEKPVSILLVEDSEDDYVLLRDLLAEIPETSFALDWSATDRGVTDLIRSLHYDVCLFDFCLGARNGVELLREVKASVATPPIVFLTGQSDRRTDLAAMEAGAVDFLVKGQIDAPRLERTLRYAMTRARYQEEIGHTYRQAVTKLETVEVQKQTLESQISELKNDNLTLAERGSQDRLTGLHNRPAFQERLKQEYQRASRYRIPLSLLLLSVEDFPQSSDGFQSGDMLSRPARDAALAQVARVLESNLRATDFAARYSDEEFGVILPQTDHPGASVLAERLNIAFAYAPYGGQKVTVNIGVCIRTDDMAGPAGLVAAAHSALYAARGSGNARLLHECRRTLI